MLKKINFMPDLWPVSIAFCFLFGNLILNVTACVSSFKLAKSGVEVHDDGFDEKSLSLLFELLLFFSNSFAKFVLDVQLRLLLSVSTSLLSFIKML